MGRTNNQSELRIYTYYTDSNRLFVSVLKISGEPNNKQVELKQTLCFLIRTLKSGTQYTRNSKCQYIIKRIITNLPTKRLFCDIEILGKKIINIFVATIARWNKLVQFNNKNYDLKIQIYETNYSVSLFISSVYY